MELFLHPYMPPVQVVSFYGTHHLRDKRACEPTLELLEPMVLGNTVLLGGFNAVS